MQWKRHALTAAMVGGLGLGLAFGLGPQGAVAAPQAQAAQPGSTPWGGFLDNLAEALGIERAALDSAIGSAGEATLDEAVAAGTLTQEQADALLPRVQAGDLGAVLGRGGPGGRGGPRDGMAVPGLRQAMRDAAAAELGITSDALSSALRDGQTLAELAAANATTEQAVIDAALAAAKGELDAAVAAGSVTRAQADAVYARLEAAGADLLGHAGRGGPGGRHGPGGPGAAPSAPSTTTPPADGDV